jgi:hypothetical protein
MGRGCASNTNVLLSYLRKNAKGTLQRIFITQKQKAPVSKFVRLGHKNDTECESRKFYSLYFHTAIISLIAQLITHVELNICIVY